VICQIRPEAYVELFLKNRNIKDLRGIFLASLERTLIACPCPRSLKPFAAQLRSGFFISHRSQTSLDRCKMKKPLILR